jgi:hypothetical protein
VAKPEKPKKPGETEREREIGLAFSEKLRESYQASRFREGVEWLERLCESEGGRSRGPSPAPTFIEAED